MEFIWNFVCPDRLLYNIIRYFYIIDKQIFDFFQNNFLQNDMSERKINAIRVQVLERHG